MLNILLLMALLSSAATLEECISPGQKINQPDYYWRDYLGVVPEDAVTGGYSPTGNVTYLGQTHDPKVSHGIFLGNIHAGRKEIRACIGRPVVDSTYVKILCSKYKERFQWKSTTTGEMHLLTDYHLVIGGAFTNEVSYIGRVNFEGQVQTSTVYPGQSKHRGIHFCSASGEVKVAQTFELLVLPR